MSLVGLATALIEGPEPKLAKFTLEGYDEELTQHPGLEARELQFWPETISDNIAVNYVDKVIPGGSHPLKQWVSNGGRTINFTVLIARDIKPKDLLPFGVELVVNPTTDDNYPFNHDVRQDIAFLRAFCYPTYDEDLGIAKPPPLCLMTAEGLGWSVYGDDTIMCVMTGCTVNYLRTFNEGFPRMATVDLSFSEIVQIVGNTFFQDRNDILDGPFFETGDAEA
jgi:hypothetical protein